MMQNWPADKVVRRKVAALVPYANNARTHSDEQVATIAASIREWGWTTPVLVDEAGMIIAGHARVLAAKSLGAEDVPAIVAKGWSEAQKRAYVIADNQLALNAEWDQNLLKPGDLWICGKHRLLCGDATKADDVARLLGGVVPNLMVTDPPYGVEYDANWRNDEFQAGSGARGAPGGRALGKVSNDDRADWGEAYALFPGQIAYVWCASNFLSLSQDSLETCGFHIRNLLIWAKTRFAISRGDYHWQHEPCWYAVRKKGDWHGDRSQSTLWTIDHQKSDTGHSTQKPVECMRRPIVNNSSPGQAVYDPFLGSGTTMIAAEMEGRQCLALEISPAYVDVAVKRWEAFTGDVAVREENRAAA